MLPEQKRDTDTLLKKAAIKVTPQRVNASSPAVDALVGDVAAYVKPVPRVEQPHGQSQGGRSQGANAQRKRVNRDDRDNGRGRDAGGRGGRSERSNDVAPAGNRHERGERPAASGRSHAPQGNGGRSAQGSGRTGGLQVGGLVRGGGSTGGARRSSPRRAQG